MIFLDIVIQFNVKMLTKRHKRQVDKQTKQMDIITT